MCIIIISLHYIGYKEEAFFLMRGDHRNEKGYKEEALHKCRYWDRRNQEGCDLAILLDIINHHETFRRFQKIYHIRKVLYQDYGIVNTCVFLDEIRLVVLWGIDGSVNHAVSVVNNRIFDGKCRNALELNTLRK
jgi:hypothetical protein